MTERTKLTANATPKSYTSLEAAARLTGLDRNTVVNHALQLYWSVVDAAERGGAELTLDLFAWRNVKITVRPGRDLDVGRRSD